MKDYCPVCNPGNEGDKPGEVDEVTYMQYNSIVIGDFLKKHMGETITTAMIEAVTKVKT